MAEDSGTNICTAALRKLGVFDPNESPNVDELSRAFSELNRMLESWGSAGSLIFCVTEIEHTLTAGTASYTISASGSDITAARPIKLASGSFVNAGGLDHPLEIISRQRYSAIRDKTGGDNSYPTLIHYRPEYPEGKIYLWPPGGGTLHLMVASHMDHAAAIGNDLEYPDEYKDAIIYNLAVRMAPEYNRNPSETVAALAIRSLANIMDRHFSESVGDVPSELTAFGIANCAGNIDMVD